MKRPVVQPLRKPKKQLPFPLNVYQTAVGRKWVMAITGIMLIGFVLAHMAGNLKMYQGPVKFFYYAEVLREIGAPVIPHNWFLWIMRLGLIGAFALHIHSAYSLAAMSRASDKKYTGSRDYIAVNFASRTMRWTGPIILLYIIWHLFDLTWGTVNPDFVKGDPYHNVVETFTSGALWSLPIYIIATLALCVHIYHGTWSLFQSLGINSPKYNQARKGLAAGLAGLILIGNLSFPILTAVGLVDEDNCKSGEAPCATTYIELQEASK